MTLLLKTFTQSKELKRTIVERSVKHKIPFRYLCKEARIGYQEFMASYINVMGASHIELEEWQVKKILRLLGISIRIQFLVDSSIDMNKISFELNEKHKE